MTDQRKEAIAFIRQELEAINDTYAGKNLSTDHIALLYSGKKEAYHIAQRPEDTTPIPDVFGFIGQGVMYENNGVKQSGTMRLNFYRKL